MPHEIAFADTAIAHLKALTARERSRVLDAIEYQLPHEPLVETRNRKLLRPNPIATWELRVGALRVFYDVAAMGQAKDLLPVVRILAVGKKQRHILRNRRKGI